MIGHDTDFEMSAQPQAKPRSGFMHALRELGPLRFAGIVACLAMVVSAVGLFQFKHEAQERRANIARLRAAISEERAAIDLLQAEWTYLNRPERIQALAERFLNLQPFTMDKVIAADSIAIREDPAPASIEDILKAQN